MFRSRWFSNFVLLSVTFVWGATFTLTKDALSHVSVFQYLSARFIIASVLLILMSIFSREARTSFQMSTFKLGTLLGVILFAVYALQTWALHFTTPAKAGFLTGLFVVFVPLLGIFFLKVWPTERIWVGVVLAIAGLAFLCGQELLHLAVGDVSLLLCAVFVALQIIFIEKHGAKTNSLALATVEITVLCICCCIVTLFQIHTDPIHLSDWLNPTVLWAILICAIPATAIAYWVQNVFQKYTNGAQAALVFSMEPVFSLIVSWIWWGERLSTLAALGSLLIFLSMMVADQNVSLRSLLRSS